MSSLQDKRKHWLATVAAIGLCGVAPSTADVVHNDDVIVEGSICVSADDLCINGENFGFIGTADVKINDSVQGIWFADSTSLDWYIGHIPNADHFTISNNSGATKLRIEQSAATDLLVMNGQGVTIGGDLSVLSSREAKERFELIDADHLLEQVASLPIYEWSFRGDSTGRRHVGPVAEEFNAAFPLAGSSSRHITVTDMAGVTLAAIQAMDRRLERLEEQNWRLAEENRSLVKVLGTALARLELEAPH